MSSRMDIALREMSRGVRTVLLVYEPNNNDHFIAILRNGTTFNIVDPDVVTYPQVVAFEHMVIFHPQMAQMFPGFQFTSTRFTNADKIAIFQEPVLQHYQALSDKHYRCQRLTAVAMSLHPRLGSAMMNRIGSLGRDILVGIANMML